MFPTSLWNVSDYFFFNLNPTIFNFRLTKRPYSSWPGLRHHNFLSVIVTYFRDCYCVLFTGLFRLIFRLLRRLWLNCHMKCPNLCRQRRSRLHQRFKWKWYMGKSNINKHFKTWTLPKSSVGVQCIFLSLGEFILNISKIWQ